MALIFISHASKDKEITQEIKNQLVNAGFEYVFLDHDEKQGIKAGEEWEKRLYLEIKRAYAFILLLSPNWVKSKWCFAEYTQARAKGKEIIPIIISHGENNEVDEWIANHIQKSDYSKDENALTRAINRLKEISLETQSGFEWDSNRSVYPGLTSFDESDAAIFFGRDVEIRSIIEKLNSMGRMDFPKLLTIEAASGLGKSSLLKAGILPRLKLSYKNTWHILPTLRPTNRPLFEFTKHIAKYLNQKDEYKNIYKSLQSNDYKNQLDEIITDIEFLDDNKTYILLPIDQAEEFYTIADNSEKKRFFKILQYLFSKDKFFMIQTIRSDYKKEFQNDSISFDFPKPYELFELLPMAKENIVAIIKDPAKIASIEIEESLVQRLIDDIKDAQALPLLALTLSKLYDNYNKKGQISLTDYLALSDGSKKPLENIVSNIANEAIAKYSHDNNKMQALKNAFIPYLVAINEDKESFVRKTALENELPNEAKEIILSLINSRLLIKKVKDEKIEIEISHEALIREWDVLKNWLDEEREFLIIKAKVEVAYKDWLQVKKKKKALLSGLTLENALAYINKLNVNEKDFVNKSQAYKEVKEKRYKELYQKAQTELEKAEHNLGLVLIEKAKNLAHKSFLTEANLLSYKAFGLLKEKYNTTNAFNEAKNILYNNQQLYKQNQTLIGHKDYISSISFSPDGKRIVSGSWDKTIKIWDVYSRELLQTLKGHENIVLSVSFSPDGKRIISGSADETIKIWDTNNGELLQTLKGHEDSVNSVSFSPDGKRIVSGSGDKTINIWDVDSGELLLTLKDHKIAVHSVSFSPDGKRVVSGSVDESIKIWDLDSGDLLQTLKDHEDIILSVSFSPDGKRIVSGSGDKTIKIWNANSGEVLLTLNHENIVYSVLFSPDGKRIVSGSGNIFDSKNNTIKIWNADSGNLLQTLKGHKDSVSSVSFSPDNKILVSGSADKTIKMWHADNEDLLQTLKGHRDSVCSVSFSPVGKRIVSGSADKTIKIWHADSGNLLLTLKGHKDSISSVSFSLDCKSVISGSKDNTIKIWNADSGNLLQTLKGHNDNVSSVSFSPDNKILVSGSEDKTIKIWDVNSGKLIQTLNGHKNSVNSVSFSPNGKRIISASGDKTIKIWDVNSGKLIQTLNGHKDSINSVSFSPNGKRIISASGDILGLKDNTIKIWDANSGKLLHTLKGHQSWINNISVSSDGKKVVSVSWDKTIKIWDADSGDLLQTLKDYKDSVNSVSFSPDSKKIALGSWNNNNIKILNIENLNNKTFIKKKIKELETSLNVQVRSGDWFQLINKLLEL